MILFKVYFSNQYFFQTNSFFVHFEKNLLLNCSSDFKPHYYRRYVDSISVLVTSLEHLEAFQKFLNGRNANISFTIENEKQNRMSFLDIKIIREGKTFTTFPYRKPTFSGVYTHFDSFLPSTYKFVCMHIYIYICICIYVYIYIYIYYITVYILTAYILNIYYGTVYIL